MKKELPKQIQDKKSQLAEIEPKIRGERLEEERIRKQAIEEAKRIIKEIEEKLEPYEKLLKEEVKKQFEGIKEGDIVEFGRYKYDVHGGVQPIAWKVIHVAGPSVTLLSQYTLERKSFGTTAAWENSSLKKWLENDFVDEAFTIREQVVLASMPSLLSYEEIQKIDGWERAAVGTPRVQRMPDQGCFWWLRSEATSGEVGCVMHVNGPGQVCGAGGMYHQAYGTKPQELMGVRPMIKVKF